MKVLLYKGNIERAVQKIIFRNIIFFKLNASVNFVEEKIRKEVYGVL